MWRDRHDFRVLFSKRIPTRDEDSRLRREETGKGCGSR